ncbi:hypothetical protein MPSEU_000437100 [Mayamaea pseudoterrestris]|nr:hypothetical protein MPSEU_000437100 [Mayamaea pseudoterrestris]
MPAFDAVAEQSKADADTVEQPSMNITDDSNDAKVQGVTSQATAEEATATMQRPATRIIRRHRPVASSEDNFTIDPVLLAKVLQESHLPDAYSWEIVKTAQKIHTLQASCIALQLPEGLLMYATVLGDALRRLCPTLTQVVILGDVCYGACCVDDLTAQALGAELLVHYGHSCLVPIQHTVLPCLYVFVQIQIDTQHLVECLEATLEARRSANESSISAPSKTTIYLLGTIQFRHALPLAQELLESKNYIVKIPQVKPLSPGEVLGCTSPKLDDGLVCFVADGRFHLESTMISNPHIEAFFRYDPYGKHMTLESYAHSDMHDVRRDMIDKAASALKFGIILGTLGRQGNPAILQKIRQVLRQRNKSFMIMLVSEITPAKLKLLPSIDAFVQVACPRLSVDWGQFLSHKPVLNPYEFFVAMGEEQWRQVYPMDYYANDSGAWTNYHETNKDRRIDIQ